MDTKTLINMCLQNDDAIETYPWEKEQYKDLCVIRHKSNNKWFALVFEMDNRLLINLKCPPDIIAVLKEQYESIMPAWHMNKKHWCTVDVNRTPTDVLNNIIKTSFEITAPKRKKQQD